MQPMEPGRKGPAARRNPWCYPTADVLPPSPQKKKPARAGFLLSRSLCNFLSPGKSQSSGIYLASKRAFIAPRFTYTLKQQLVGLLAEHSYLLKYEALRERNAFRPALSAAQVAEVKPAVHPVVRTDPQTGRKSLFVSEHFTTRILGLPEGRSAALLAELFAHSTQPQFVYRHHWRDRDMVFWDNRAVLHLATGVPAGQRRKLYRTTIEGDVPV